MGVAVTTHAFTLGPPQQAVAEVVELLSDGRFAVEHQGRRWHCGRAASCLLAPALGDSVLIGGDGHKLWMIAVLDRATSEYATRLSVEGDLHIETPTGSLSLHSEHSLNFSGEALALKAHSGNCRINKLNYSGEDLSAVVSVIRMVGKRFESLCHSVNQVSDILFRKVRQTEHVRVGQMDYQAEDYARLHARNTFITSKDITKLDSEQIHIG